MVADLLASPKKCRDQYLVIWVDRRVTKSVSKCLWMRFSSKGMKIIWMFEYKGYAFKKLTFIGCLLAVKIYFHFKWLWNYLWLRSNYPVSQGNFSLWLARLSLQFCLSSSMFLDCFTNESLSSSAKFEAMLFAVCKDEENRASMRTFLEVTHSIISVFRRVDSIIICLQEINRTGVRAKTDPRLKSVIQRLEKYRPRPGASLENITLDFDQFKDVLSGNLPLLAKIFRNDLVIPEFESFSDNVRALYDKLKDNFDGAVRQTDTYHEVCYSCLCLLSLLPTSLNWPGSPRRSGASPSAPSTAKGSPSATSTTSSPFNPRGTKWKHKTIPYLTRFHCSKPITYSLTLQELGTDVVHRYQGREPSGRMFNEIVLDHNSESS